MNIATYLTLITAIIAAFMTFSYQQRLKAFELFLARREAVLKDIEVLIDKLYSIKRELKTKDRALTREYLSQSFHIGLIIYHKTKSSNFGPTADIMNETYWAIIRELITENLNKKYKYR